MNTIFSREGWDDYQHWVDTDRKMLARVNRLIQEAKRTPFTGTGKPEPLRNNLSGYWSRRIDQEHRLIYRVQGDDLIIIQCRDHY